MVIAEAGPVAKKRAPAGKRWAVRDWIAALALFAATAVVILWQNAHVAVLWDLSYVLDTANRIALGQMPYRDFPLAHAPLTFLVQAALIRLTGHVYWHHIVYTAVVGGLGTVLAWRIALETLRERVCAAWPISLLLAAPLAVLGMYCILPHPSYDCDCAFWMLVAIWALQRVEVGHSRMKDPSPCPILSPALSAKGWETTGLAPPVFVPSRPCDSKKSQGRGTEDRFQSGAARGFCAGALACLPLFFKQNMGLPFLAAVVGAVAVLLFVRSIRRVEFTAAPADRSSSVGWLSPDARDLWALVAGVATTLAVAFVGLRFTAGVGNYLHWTIGFAAQRRLPGVTEMLGVYLDPNLLWELPCVVAGLVLLRIGKGTALWSRIVAFGLLIAPFAWMLCSLLLYDDADERGDALLALWPILLIVAGVVAICNVYRLRNALTLRASLPFVILVAINGTLMSQQLWGSTYAIWPLLVLLLAELVASLSVLAPRSWFIPALAAFIAATLFVCGGLYTSSEERLSYAQFPAGAAEHSADARLAGLSIPGAYLPNFDELLRYADENIPIDDGLILLPGEDPFYYATGRVPRFPVLLFDPATDPYSPGEAAALVQTRDIHWLIVKRDLQLMADPTPERAVLLLSLEQEFTLAARLRGYDVYRR
jgi:hypothetical protein